MAVKISVYYAPFCPYCGWAKQLLDSKNVSYTMINVNDSAEIRQQMETLSQRTSVPQIFINDQHIGGYDDLAALDEQGGLDTLLET